MKWLLDSVDVKVGQPLDQVEARCSAGWEPFAITEFKRYETPDAKIATPYQRFWFKKKVK